ncbi:MAG: UDP-N-acetylmuramate dehydrogenase [Desulfovibrio sp.]|jgi:UDP-N-acetylmuramate dehydrogenase|nr:UDP-N-acetylmuramate dehydrogenase [Desulfovibrio sp.]
MREIPEPFLSDRTTLRLGGFAIAELILETSHDLDIFPERLRILGGIPLVLGAGSNILARDGQLPLVLVRPRYTHGPETTAEREDKVFVRVGAGVPLARFLRFCLKNGFSGMEGLVGIPGSVGGCIAVNAGSFGTETARHLHDIQIVSSHHIKTVPAADAVFGYRSFSIPGEKNNFIILEATFVLTKSQRDVIGKRMFHNFFEKKSKQPLNAWSAGCIFKNPSPQTPAGRLLEEAGFKGKRRGGVSFSSVHANFLINEGKGSAGAALDMIDEARAAVLQRFGIELTPEVRIVPCRS